MPIRFPAADMDFRMNLRDIQQDHKMWVKHNFGDRPSTHPLLGVGEEYGELIHAHLKCEQGIRGTPEEHHAAKIDAVGDIVLFLMDYCTAEDIDMQEAIEQTWAEVQKRDWKSNPSTGDVVESAPHLAILDEREILLFDELAKITGQLIVVDKSGTPTVSYRVKDADGALVERRVEHHQMIVALRNAVMFARMDAR